MKIRECYIWLYLMVLLVVIFTGLYFILSVVSKDFVGMIFVILAVSIPTYLGLIIIIFMSRSTIYFFNRYEVVQLKKGKQKVVSYEQIKELTYINPINILKFQIGSGCLNIKYNEKTGQEPFSIKYKQENILCISMSKKQALQVACDMKKLVNFK